MVSFPLPGSETTVSGRPKADSPSGLLSWRMPFQRRRLPHSSLRPGVSRSAYRYPALRDGSRQARWGTDPDAKEHTTRLAGLFSEVKALDRVSAYESECEE